VRAGSLGLGSFDKAIARLINDFSIPADELASLVTDLSAHFPDTAAANRLLSIGFDSLFALIDHGQQPMRILPNLVEAAAKIGNITGRVLVDGWIRNLHGPLVTALAKAVGWNVLSDAAHVTRFLDDLDQVTGALAARGDVEGMQKLLRTLGAISPQLGNAPSILRGRIFEIAVAADLLRQGKQFIEICYDVFDTVSAAGRRIAEVDVWDPVERVFYEARSSAGAFLSEAETIRKLERMKAAGAEKVVFTVPDLATDIPSFMTQQWLRSMERRFGVEVRTAAVAIPF
jgi:hypothetical protein